MMPSELLDRVATRIRKHVRLRSLTNTLRRRGSRKRILAISSGGGHWIELMRLKPAFAGMDVVYATVSDAYRAHVEGARLHVVRDATRWDRKALLQCAWGVLRACLEERPDVVISTGALPGFFGLMFGKILGARTIWVDSLANVEELSLSGQKVQPFADLWLTQWAELSHPDGPEFAGAIL